MRPSYSPSCWKFLLVCAAVDVSKSVYTLSAPLNRAKIKYQTPCLCFPHTFLTRPVDEAPVIFISTHSRWTADLSSGRSRPTGTMSESDVGGSQVSVWDACTTAIRERVDYQEDSPRSGVCKVFLPTCQGEPPAAPRYRQATRSLK